MSHKKIRDYRNLPIVSRQEARDAGLKQYFSGEKCDAGHIAPRYVRSCACLVCLAAKSLAWQKHMYATNGDAYRTRIRMARLRNPAAVLYRGVKARANTRGIEFTITQSDVVIPESCPCCSRSIRPATGEFKKGARPDSPSVDRLDNDRGYVPGNVAVICWRCNELKRDASIEELRTILVWMERLWIEKNFPTKALKLVS